ncbi:MAG: sugar phosphate isomerase/epimerase [Gemmatimonadetes bacterium]|nr:sugar phosphate isomerase/epimerase [Gemmatimonadota bacterium]MBT5057389.1 sugar phosphate isomerase/epimerase [Gemmatimonadota bacterium]MBT5591893.1 sugar phosphate isomerase/epimerase [Gemmatimonadota bacterium]MBT5961568.1 sugar phosphate isomerase/epimerase [Gemmatimonadota bacterium]MBT7453744.1 sugar phosphate isomerase/epimerase [Gemmatimonadota bacterium]
MTHYSFMLIDSAPILDADPNHVFGLLQEYGYEGVELNLTPQLVDRLDLVERTVRGCGLSLPSFLTGAAYSPDCCLSSADVDARKHAVDRLVGHLDIAERFGAILVVGLLQGLHTDEPDATQANRRIVDCLRQVGDAAEKRGVDIVIEPINHLQVGFNNSVAEVRSLIEAIGSPALRPMVDTIHMNIEETSLTQPILDCGSELRHVHLCESNGGVLGKGHLDFTAVTSTLGQIGYEGFASVKVYRKASLEEAAQASMAYLQSLAV